MSEIYEICVETDFSAAHCIVGYPGNCARVHGHNWKVEVKLQSMMLNEIGIAVDFREVKKALGEVIAEFDHHYLNDLTQFRLMNPTSENIARYLFHELSGRLNQEKIKVCRVKVAESDKAWASYRED